MVRTRRRSSRQRGRRGRRSRSRVDPGARERALEALNRMRTQGLSLTRAARASQTTPQTVRKYVRSALTRKKGRYAATPSDRLTRRVWLLTARGKVEITVRGSRPASRVAQYMTAVDRYLRTGDTEALRAFADQTIRAGKVTHRFATDTAVLDRLALAGEVSFDRLYVLRA